jgi:hypothetical protein
VKSAGFRCITVVPDEIDEIAGGHPRLQQRFDGPHLWWIGLPDDDITIGAVARRSTGVIRQI